MTIHFFTGFEGCGGVASAIALFDAGSSGGIVLSSTGGFDNSKGITDSFSSRWVQKNITATKTAAAGLHVRNLGYTTNLSNVTSVMTFAGPAIHIINYASNDLRVCRGTTTIASGITNIPSGITHVEAKVFSDATAGTVQIKINGKIVADLTGLNTGGADITGVSWGATGRIIDNLYIADDLQGEIYSVLLKPSSDSAVAFTPSTGIDNYAMVDDLGDGDTTYVHSATVTDQDLYGYEELAANLIPKAVTVVTVARKEGTGLRSIQTQVKQDATEYDVGVEKTLSPTYPDALGNSSMVTTLATCPDTTAWTRTKLNAMQFGFKVSA